MMNFCRSWCVWPCRCRDARREPVLNMLSAGGLTDQGERRVEIVTFQDIFKSNFLENITGISILDMAIALILAFLMGLFIFFIYKKSCSSVMYSASFGTTLIA